MTPGFVYVLANSAMPDLVKIGFRTDDPTQRAADLSAVTGLPVPFIVVYKRWVEDCEAAEQLLHEQFEWLGTRVAGNREFFSAPVSEVVDAIVQLPIYSIGRTSADERPHSTPVLSSRDSWFHLWIEAEALEYGINGHLKDPAGALELYRKCARLGSKWAHYPICRFELRDALQKNKSARLLKAVRIGEQKGNYICLLLAARYFVFADEDETASTAFEAFFRMRAAKPDPEMDHALDTVSELATSLVRALHLVPSLSINAVRQLVGLKESLLQSYEQTIGYLEASRADLAVLGPYHEARYQIESI